MKSLLTVFALFLTAISLLAACNAHGLLTPGATTPIAPTATAAASGSGSATAPTSSGSESDADAPPASGNEWEHLPAPDLVGLTLEQANAKLRAAGFLHDANQDGGHVIRTDSCQDGSMVGRVCAQAPVAGDDTTRGWGVEVKIGWHDTRMDRLVVPDVRGMTPDDAKRALQRAGFSVEESIVEVDQSCKPKLVCSQTPSAGDQASRASRFGFYVGP